MLKVALLKGVIIFGLFAADRDFGTHPKLFLRVILPESSSAKLSAYKSSNPGPRLFKKIKTSLIQFYNKRSRLEEHNLQVLVLNTIYLSSFK